MSKKVRSGIVIADKMDKTRIILVTRRVRHSEYGKVLTKRKKYYAHDEKNLSHTGDRVGIIESRPLSRLKRWRVDKVLEKGK